MTGQIHVWEHRHAQLVSGCAVVGQSRSRHRCNDAYLERGGSQLFPHSNPAVVISRHLNAAPPAVSDLRPELAELDAVLSKALARGRTPPIAIRCAGFRPGPLPVKSARSVLVIIGRIKAFRIHPLFGYTGVTDNPPGTGRADEALAGAFHD